MPSFPSLFSIGSGLGASRIFGQPTMILFKLKLSDGLRPPVHSVHAMGVKDTLQTWSRGHTRILFLWVCWVNLYYSFIFNVYKNIILISGLSIVQGFISTLTRPKRRRKIGSRLSMQLWQQRKWKPLMKCKKLLLPRPKTSQWEFKNWCLSKYLIFYHITIMHWITLGYCVTIFIHALSS